MATELHHLSDYNEDLVPDASNMCFGIVVAEWNPEITNALLTGCVATLRSTARCLRTSMSRVYLAALS